MAVDFVGPREDVFDNIAQAPGSMAYAEPDFDRDHAARWGLWLQLPDIPIGDLVRTYQPDVVVEMLGLNDFIWGNQSAAEVTAALEDWVDQVRAEAPDADLVLVEQTKTRVSQVPAYNAALPGVATRKSTETSAITVAEAAVLDEYADTWDRTHPNARGDRKIADAVADALHDLGIGPPADRSVPLPKVGLHMSPLLGVRAGTGQARLRWTAPPGATGTMVWQRDVSARERWRRLPTVLTGREWTARSLLNGHHYRFKVEPVKGDDLPQGTTYSRTVEVVPLLRAPRRLRGRPRAGCLALTWRRVRGAESYRVQVWNQRWRTIDTPTSPRSRIRHLPPTSRWRLRVAGVADGGPGRSTTITVERRSPGQCR